MKIVRDTSFRSHAKQYVDNIPNDGVWDVSAVYDSTNNTIKFSVKTYAVSNISNYDPESKDVSVTTESTIYQNFVYTLKVEDLQLRNHSAFAIVTDVNNTPLKEGEVNKTDVVDLFKITFPSKLKKDVFAALYDKAIYGILVVPFADSAPSDMIFVVNTDFAATVNFSQTGFNEQLPDTTNWLGLFPKINSQSPISSTPNSQQQFEIQLTDSKKNPIEKTGVVVQLETTGGILSSDNIVTDERGIAIGTLYTPSVPSDIVIKAGFKYYSGLKNIKVTVS